MTFDDLLSLLREAQTRVHFVHDYDLRRRIDVALSAHDAAIAAAYQRGVEAMRAAAVEVARKRADLPATSDTDAAWCRSAQCIVDELRDLSAPEMTR
jgi:hypothetical protein